MASSFSLVVTYAGRHGRCHLRPLADRQYAIGRTNELTAPIVRTLKDPAFQCECQDIFGAISPTPADAFIYSDGSHPDELHDDPPRIGWAAFLSESISGGEQVLYGVNGHHEYGLGEMVAGLHGRSCRAVAALHTLASRLRGQVRHDVDCRRGSRGSFYTRLQLARRYS